MDFLLTLLRALLGLFVLLGVCYLISENRKAIDWRTIGSGIILQPLLAILILKVPGVSQVFDVIAGFFNEMITFSREGAAFIFGSLVTNEKTFGNIFAFQVLPTIVFYSALASVLFYYGILQRVIYGLAWIMSKTMRLSGPESFSTAANVFIGQTEAPLLIKPFLEKFTRSEMFCVMVGGMATIAGGVFAAYIGFLGGDDPVKRLFFAKHLLTASILAAPASIVASKLIVPETNHKPIDEQLKIEGQPSHNVLDAITTGTTEGLMLAVNVGAMLLVFTALIYMVNAALLSGPGTWFHLNGAIKASTAGRFEGLTFTYILGQLFAPIAWLLGTPVKDITLVGELLGMKTMINEFVAYGELGNMRTSGVQLEPKSVLIATYALCGFSNFASIGIQIGGIGALAPGQRKNLTELGIKALIAGSVAGFMTALTAAFFA